MENPYAIKVDSVSRNYGSNIVVDNLSFDVYRGSVHGFLGPNGAGKTTTMKMITGIIPPSSGRIDLASEKIGALLDIPPLFLDMIVKEYLRYICTIQGVLKDKIDSYVDQAIEQLKLQDVSHRLIKNLSKGYKQRVGIAQAIVFKPDIVILDEPTIGLDPASVIEMRELISQIAKNHTVLISSHLLHEIELICDSITIINKGKLVATGDVQSVKSKVKSNQSLIIITKEKETSLIDLKEAFDFVDSVEETQNNHEFHYQVNTNTQRDCRKEVLNFIIQNNISVLEFSSQKSNLESSFLELMGEMQ